MFTIDTPIHMTQSGSPTHLGSDIHVSRGTRLHMTTPLLILMDAGQNVSCQKVKGWKYWHHTGAEQKNARNARVHVQISNRHWGGGQQTGPEPILSNFASVHYCCMPQNSCVGRVVHGGGCCSTLLCYIFCYLGCEIQMIDTNTQ